jgi:HD superfamily phosphohydrolase
MPGKIHEVRDPVHVFIRLDSSERRVLDSPAIQRLRHIHQLALTYLVYPGATHSRFEHSLGVMELASRVYDVVCNPDNVDSIFRDLVPHKGEFEYEYWRHCLRMAALCHDLGHLPFSHAAEKELLPEGWNHERLTAEIIRSDELQKIWQENKIQTQDVIKLALGPKGYSGNLSPWETILSEILVGDAFGVDRMDYLLRDSHYVGIASGRFDHFRLVDTLRILPREKDSDEPALGIEEGGLQSAESLLWARYFMYTQVYFHPVRRIHDIHLKEFLKGWLPGGAFPTTVSEFLQFTDNEVTSAILDAARESNKAGHEHARRIIGREHYRLLYQRNPDDLKRNLESGTRVLDALCKQFGADALRRDQYSQKSHPIDFAVRTRDDRIVSSIFISETLRKVPVFAVDYIFIKPSLREKAERWLVENRDKIISQEME